MFICFTKHPEIDQTMAHPIKAYPAQAPIRKFKVSWKVDRPWLQYDPPMNVMKCTYCIKFEAQIKKLLKTKRFIKGCKTMKLESLQCHEKSKAHKSAEQMQIKLLSEIQ
ncbi:unnamed protein product [Owenia fusiformis]|uniref:C17orf113 probable zinc finger domain-containing protein n=1 Tax=Owenia fusiformis TaxID=6347 RepID=A0A8J1XLZ3_OWEFU|nr:unnamed protein product [Owenia fusiformis]